MVVMASALMLPLQVLPVGQQPMRPPEEAGMAQVKDVGQHQLGCPMLLQLSEA